MMFRFAAPVRSPGDSGPSAPEAARDVRLPVVGAEDQPRGKIRPSKNGKRRAIVLTLVHVVILAHIAHWLWAGSTISPIEPSEAMEFSKRGIVNAGLIFFALALLSTLILGRWFCGWGCHLVALQDLCGWMMKKCGIRPKPFRSRTLIYVPLLLGLYMFIWPAFYRLAIAPWVGTSDRLPPWGVEAHLTTSDFWATFPGWAVAIPFLLICGFATVYVLGQKGFCTYGCPYGGFFAPLDRYAPARIRVTDSCEQSGHCTAVCTSNVRVHEEVRDYGMVTDPGCMKCLDCVSVCPNDALYFGFGATPGLTSEARKTRIAPEATAPKQRRFDMSLREDLAVAALFAIIFFAFRGEYARFPLLMAAGVAMVMTFIVWKAWRVARDPNVNVHRWQLKMRSGLKPAGLLVISLALVLIALVIQSGTVNAFSLIASHHDDRVHVPRHVVLWTEYEPDEETHEHAQRAIAWYERAATVSMNGFGLATSWRSMIDMRRAWLHSVLGEFERAEALLRGVLDREGDRASEPILAGMGSILAAQPAKRKEAIEWYRYALVQRSSSAMMLDEFIGWASVVGEIDSAIEVVQARLEQEPRDVHTMRWLALLKLETGQPREGIALLRRLLKIDPDDERARDALRRALAQYPE